MGVRTGQNQHQVDLHPNGALSPDFSGVSRRGAYREFFAAAHLAKALGLEAAYSGVHYMRGGYLQPTSLHGGIEDTYGHDDKAFSLRAVGAIPIGSHLALHPFVGGAIRAVSHNTNSFFFPISGPGQRAQVNWANGDYTRLHKVVISPQCGLRASWRVGNLGAIEASYMQNFRRKAYL